ncbi:MAG TPA: radical SAM protein [Thermoplasmata archaeon]|nr:radical SAM protein [Thermoplasmata archaeon]
MTNITGVKRDLLLVKMLKHKEVRDLPREFLFYLRSQMKHEKFVKIWVDHPRFGGVKETYVINSQVPPYPSPAFTQFLRVGNEVQNGRTAPSSCHIAATNRCPYNCWHCSNGHRPECVDLDLDLLKDTIAKLQDMGNSLIGITGGEPLLRDDLEEIIAAIDERSVVMLFTTGYGLTPERVRRLKEAGLFYAVVSLDHFVPEKHDALRGFEGAFDHAVKAIRMFKEAGLYTVASAVPPNEMIDSGEIWQFVEFLRNLGVHEVRFLAPIPTGNIVGQRDLRWKRDQARVMAEIHERFNADRDYPRITVFGYIETESFLGCCAGTFHIFIENDGTLTPCDMIPLNFGNIKTCGIEKAYQRMVDVFKNPRYDCFVRAAVTLLGKAYEEEGRLPLSREKSLAIARKVPNNRMAECFKQLRMPYRWSEEEMRGRTSYGDAGGCMGAFKEGTGDSGGCMGALQEEIEEELGPCEGEVSSGSGSPE